MTNDRFSAPTVRYARTVARIDPLLVDIGIGLTYLLTMLPGLAHSLLLAEGSQLRAAAVALAATFAAACVLMFRRRTPIATLCVCVILLLVVKTLMYDFPDPLGLAIAGYAVAAHPTRRTAFITVPSSVIVIALIIVAGAPSTGDTRFVGELLILNLVVFAPACLLGLLISALSRRRQSAGLGGIRPSVG
jgi:hypothetical protein